MSGIQGKNTKPEIIVRRGMHARGFRYSLHTQKLPGKPDLVMPKWKVAIFVHGCFWHRHKCSLSKLPSTNTEFWYSKLETNTQRDELVASQLRLAGWRVAIVWECSTRGKAAMSRLPHLLDDLATWIREHPESDRWDSQIKTNTTRPEQID